MSGLSTIERQKEISDKAFALVEALKRIYGLSSSVGAYDEIKQALTACDSKPNK